MERVFLWVVLLGGFGLLAALLGAMSWSLVTLGSAQMAAVTVVLLAFGLASQWRWRRRGLQALALGSGIGSVVAALAWLGLLFNTEAWWRWTGDKNNAVTAHGGYVLTTEYQQGLATFKEMTDAAVEEAIVPVLILAVLATLPAVIGAGTRLKTLSPPSGLNREPEGLAVGEGRHGG